MVRANIKARRTKPSGCAVLIAAARWCCGVLTASTGRTAKWPYKTGRMSREESYRWLADKICVPMREAHIGHLGEYYCKMVIQDIRTLLEPHNARSRHGPRERRVS